MCLSAKLFLTAIRARVCGQTGDLQQAAEALDPISNKRIPHLVGGQDWLRTQARLVGIYRKLGGTGDARKIEDELRKLLAVADPENPILQQLRKTA